MILDGAQLELYAMVRKNVNKFIGSDGGFLIASYFSCEIDVQAYPTGDKSVLYVDRWFLFKKRIVAKTFFLIDHM